MDRAEHFPAAGCCCVRGQVYNRCRRVLRSLGAFAALALSVASGQGGTVYIDGPGASDAQKIATQMLNDAASGRWRNSQFGPLANNPYTKMIEEYEARQRAKALEMENAAREAVQRRAEREAEERQFREEQARSERVRREWGRIDALQKEAANLSTTAHLRLGMIFESGKYDAEAINLPPGKNARAYARERYLQAAKLDSTLGEVAVACLEHRENPNFPTMWDALQGMSDSGARRDYLLRLAERGHVGASYWLGLWAAGKNVGLGSFPPPPGETNEIAFAIRWLARADTNQLGAIYADVVLQSDPTPAARQGAVSLLERLATPDGLGDALAYIALSRELLRRGRFESDMARPRALLNIFHKEEDIPGMRALAAMHLDGTDGLFRPAQAAKVYRRMPEKPRFMALRGASHVFEGMDAIFGVEQPASPTAARAHFEEAERILAQAPGVYRAEDLGLQVEAALWRAFARAEAGETGVGEADPVEFLMQLADTGRGLGRLLFRAAILGRKTTSSIRASTIWGFIRSESPFTAPLSPAEILLHLQCAIRAYDRGGAPELAPVVETLRALPPREAPIRGAALLAQLTFLPGKLGRDSADRRGLAAVYGALFRAAWRDPRLWGETAALVEVLQIEPIQDADWTQGWLAPWLADPSERTVAARAWAEVLRHPGAQTWKTAAGQPWGRLVESLLGDTKSSLSLPVQALRDSLQLRGAEDVETAEAAFRSLLKLGREQCWHAQALLEDFEARYRAAYNRRGSAMLFREHSREVAETQANWRSEGHGFCRRDGEERWRAVGRALESGSIRFGRAEVEGAAKDGSEAARMVLLRLKARESSPGLHLR